MLNLKKVLHSRNLNYSMVCVGRTKYARSSVVSHCRGCIQDASSHLGEAMLPLHAPRMQAAAEVKGVSDSNHNISRKHQEMGNPLGSWIKHK
jgi:hypothetical protein